MRIPYTQKEVVGVITVVIAFMIAQYYAQHYTDAIQHAIGVERRAVGMTFYGLVAIIAIVVAPISSLPLVPIAAAVWGSFATLVVTVIAWTIGSIIAFLLARVYGKRIIGKVVDMESMRRLEATLGWDDVFMAALLLRMVVPVDILSYALGLFSTIKIVPYCVATMIGIIPFAIFFSYAIVIPVFYQLIIAVVIFSLVLLIMKKRSMG